MHRSAAATLPLVLLVAGCAGAGGGTSSLPGVTAPVSGSATLAPAGAHSLSGQVLDLSGYANGGPGWSVLQDGSPARGVAPVSGATVVVGPVLIAGGTAPAVMPAGDTSTVTDARGNFVINPLSPGDQFVMVFPGPGDRIHTAAIHRAITLGNGPALLPTLLMAAVTSDEKAWLARVNRDRVANGSSPLIFDEALLESARYWANFMASNGYFAHCDPASACTPGDTATPPPSTEPFDANPETRDAYFGAAVGYWGENIAAGFTSWSGAENAFMAEKTLCPGDSAAGCPFSDKTGHFLNIVDPGFNWTGLGAASSDKGYFRYYDEEFGIAGASSTAASFAHLRLSPPLAP